MDFYESDEACVMADAYKQQVHTSIMKVEELLQQADETQRRIETTNRILLRRRRIQLELKLQRILLTVLATLSPEAQELGAQVYERLVSCVDRMEKLC